MTNTTNTTTKKINAQKENVYALLACILGESSAEDTLTIMGINPNEKANTMAVKPC